MGAPLSISNIEDFDILSKKELEFHRKIHTYSFYILLLMLFTSILISLLSVINLSLR